MLIPKSGEIWEINRLVKCPVILSRQDQENLYSNSAQEFFSGNSLPRYVMIVQEPEPSKKIEECYLIIYVMLLSLETDFISDIDVLITPQISGLTQDILAETWHIIPTLLCNLFQPVGKRIPFHIYSYLLMIREYYYGLIPELPIISEIPYLGLKNKSLWSVKNSKIQYFHQQEQAWSDVLTVPVAAYTVYMQSIDLINQVLNEGCQIEYDLQYNFSD